MKLTVHIPMRYVNINRIEELICEFNTYEIETDIFIHTFDLIKHSNLNIKYKGFLEFIYVPKLNKSFDINDSCRLIMRSQKNLYDFFMFSENDINVPYNAIQYWINYKNCIQNNNLGFVRVDNKDNLNDFNTLKKEKTIVINNEKFIINKVHCFCGMWIYDKSTFELWINEVPFNICKFKDPINDEVKQTLNIAFRYGLHFPSLTYYKNTIIPLQRNGTLLNPNCKLFKLNTNNQNSNKFYNCVI